MDLWAVLVVGVLKQGLRCDHDRLRELANEHGTIQQMPSRGGADDSRCELENIRDNVELMMPELLPAVDRLIVETGHKVAGKEPCAVLVARCGSFVVETDVRYPTDFNLLQDSIRCLTRETARACGTFGVRGWRQREHHQRTVEELYGKASTSRKWDSPPRRRPKLCAARKIADKTQASHATLRGAECPTKAV